MKRKSMITENMDVSEKMIVEQYGRELDYLWERYKDHIQNVDGVFRAKQGRAMSDFDVYSLGKMIENYESYIQLVPEAISQNYLGRVLPNMIDIISAAYVTSVMPAISSIQPMSELVGVIFYKTNRVNGVQTFDYLGKRNTWVNDQYASDLVENELIGTFAAGSGATYLTCTGTLAKHGCRRGTLLVKILDTTNADALLVSGVSDSNGNIYGPNGLTGTVNVDTGDITVELVHDEVAGAAVGDKVVVTYNFDFEADFSSIPKSTFVLTDRTVRARIFMLEGQWGLITEYALQKRFGRAMDVEVANDLRAEINAEVASAAIKAMYAQQQGVSKHALTLPANTSAYEHRMMFRDVINKATNTIIANAGKGKVSYMVCGYNVAVALQSQPGYKVLDTGTEVGPHVAGQLDEITIIKANTTELVPDNEAIAGYRGASWFEAGVVYAPYLPLFLTGTVQIGSAFQKAQGAAHAAALEVVVPSFLTKIAISD